jgi:tetratricopeptide (TPR) repeat protein
VSDLNRATAWGENAISWGKLLGSTDDFDHRALAQAYANRANVEYKLKRHQDVVRDFDRAIELDPENPHLYLSRSVMFRLLGKGNDAAQDLAHCIQIDPDRHQRQQMIQVMTGGKDFPMFLAPPTYLQLC